MQKDSGKNMITLEKYADLKTAVKETQKVKFLAFIYTFQENRYIVSL